MKTASARSTAVLIYGNESTKSKAPLCGGALSATVLRMTSWARPELSMAPKLDCRKTDAGCPKVPLPFRRPDGADSLGATMGATLCHMRRYAPQCASHTSSRTADHGQTDAKEGSPHAPRRPL